MAGNPWNDYQPATAPAVPAGPWSDYAPKGTESSAAGDVASGVWDKLSPMSMATGAMATLKAIREKPLDVAKEIFLHPYMAIGRGVEAAKLGKIDEAAAHFNDALFGVPGSGTEEASVEMATPGQRATGVGHALGIGAAAYAGAKLPDVIPPAYAATKAAVKAGGSDVVAGVGKTAAGLATAKVGTMIPGFNEVAGGIVGGSVGAPMIGQGVVQAARGFRAGFQAGKAAIADTPAVGNAAQYAGISTTDPAALATPPATPPLLNSPPLAPVADLRAPVAAAPAPPNPFANSTLDRSALVSPPRPANAAAAAPPTAGPPAEVATTPFKEQPVKDFAGPARLAKSIDLAKALQSAGMTADDVRLLESQGQLEQHWPAIAERASKLKGKTVNVPKSAASVAETIHQLRLLEAAAPSAELTQALKRPGAMGAAQAMRDAVTPNGAGN